MDPQDSQKESTPPEPTSVDGQDQSTEAATNPIQPTQEPTSQTPEETKPLQSSSIVQDPPKKRNWVNIVLFALIPIILVILGILGYQNYQLRQQLKAPVSTPPPSTPALTPTPTTDPTAEWTMYENSIWGFSVKYPPESLVACDNISKEQGLRLWPVPFNCPIGHDQIYEIGILGYKPGEYKHYKTPSSTIAVDVNGTNATQYTYVYGDEDGPLQTMKQSIVIVIEKEDMTIAIQFVGTDPSKQIIFDQILSTFEFTE